MAIDMSQFYETFFAEAAEHLADLEGMLVALDLTAPDDEALNAIFRAAHSIKGGAATFGISEMAEVTHVLESLLDRVRRHEMPITAAMVDEFLAAGDVLKHQLAARSAGGVAHDEAAAGVMYRLQQLAQDRPEPSAAGPAAAPQGAGGLLPKPGPVATRSVEICLHPGAHGWSQRISLAGLQEDLARLGEIVLLQLPETDPLGHQAGPDAVLWRLRLDTSASLADIADRLQFALDADQFTLTGPPDGNGDPGYGFFDEEPAAQPENDDFGFFDDAPGAPQPAARALDPAPDHPAVAEVPTTSADRQQSVGGEQAPTAGEPAATAAGKPAPAPGPGGVGGGKSAGTGELASIRVPVEKVDLLLNLVGELVITQAMLAQTTNKLDPATFERLHAGVALLERNSRDLQEAVMSVRMMPIGVVFSRFPRLVRDLATRLGKDIELRMAGEATELDRGLIEKISDPLTHLVRNSLDHGIELPEARRTAGKPARGCVWLSASHQGGSIVVEVKDDGGGLQREKILAKARERGLAVPDSLSDQDVYALIFEPGFSTAEAVTEVSGRGVGMDVVRRNIQGMGGSVEIDSTPGHGTRVSIRLPLTLAILDGMTVAVGAETYILPLAFVIESIQPRREDLKSVGGDALVVKVRDSYLPVLRLHRIFGLKSAITDPTRGILVVLDANGERAALFVDDLLGQQQVVIKSLETNYRKVEGFSGATIMGDGRVAFILDAPALVKIGRRAAQF